MSALQHPGFVFVFFPRDKQKWLL